MGSHTLASFPGAMQTSLGTLPGALEKRGSAQKNAVEYSREEILKYSQNMQTQYQKMVAALDGSDTVDLHKANHTRLIFQALVPIGNSLTFMTGLCETRNHERLKEIFADDDCLLIASLRETTEEIKAMLAGANIANDERIEHCLKVCGSIEDVLKSIYRLEDKLKAAKERAHQNNLRVKSATKDLSPVDRLKLILEIDEGEDPLAATELLWQSFDASDAGKLSGDTYHSVLETFCQYVSDESWQRSEAKSIPSLYHTPDSSLLRDLVSRFMDPDGDATITKDEFIAGAQQVVDDIDPPQKRASLLDDKRKLRIEKLWEEADASGAGALSGAAYQAIIQKYCGYVSEQSAERSQALAAKIGKVLAEKFHHTPESLVLRELVQQFMDPNGDGSIDKQEFVEGAIRVMDDVEAPSRRKSVLDQRLSMRAQA